MRARRCGCGVLGTVLLAAAVAACGPAPLEGNLPAYQQLLYLVHAENPGGGLWLPTTAPPEARRLMSDLRISAVYYDLQAEAVYFRSGGGYMPERGYVYYFPRDGAPGARGSPGYHEEPIKGNWYSRRR